MFRAVSVLSRWAVPAIVVFIPIYAYLKGVRVYEVFVEGAREGFNTALRILPNLLAMLVVIGIMRNTNIFRLLEKACSPLLQLIGMPPEVMPLCLIRPLSGSGALGLTTDILNTYGPDSFIGLLASTIQGSTDTTFYVITVYFASVGVYHTRHAIPAGLIGDLVGALAALVVCRLYFL